MTIPTLISNYRKHQAINQFKATISILSNAIRMGEAKNGSAENWNVCDTDQPECTEQIFNNFSQELKIIKKCVPTADECWTSTSSISGEKGYLKNQGQNASRISIILNNGSSIYMWAGGNSGATNGNTTGMHLQMWVDINGPQKGKNMLGADVFGLVIKPIGGEKPKIYTNGADGTITDINALKTAPYGCSKNVTGIYAGLYCGGLIQYNNWEVPNDYPIRF